MDIKALIRNYKSTTLECKKATGEIPNSIWKLILHLLILMEV